MPDPSIKNINFSELRDKVLHYANESLNQFMHKVEESEVNQLIDTLQVACAQTKDLTPDKKFYVTGLAFMNKFRAFTYGRKTIQTPYCSITQSISITDNTKSLAQIAREVISLHESLYAQQKSYPSCGA